MRNIMSAALIAAGALLGWSGGAVASADSTCTNFGGSLQDDQMCSVHSSSSTYTLNMTFPVDYPDQALSDFLTQNRDGFINVAQTSSQTSGPRDVPYQMEVTSEQYRSGQPPGGTRSVVLKVFEDLGGPRPSTFFKGFNFDVASQKSDHLRHAFRAEYEAAGFDISHRPTRSGKADRTWCRNCARFRTGRFALSKLCDHRRRADFLLCAG